MNNGRKPPLLPRAPGDREAPLQANMPRVARPFSPTFGCADLCGEPICKLAGCAKLVCPHTGASMKVVRDIRIDYQSTPALWMAYRGDGEKIEHHGLGKTPIEALAHLLEQELEAEPVD